MSVWNTIKSWLEYEPAHTVQLPAPTPPMPECKPYKAPKISEPVITLLEVLKRDEWEPETILDYYGVSYKITNIYNESVVFEVFETSGGSCGLEGYPWMTKDEKSIVAVAVRKCGQDSRCLNTKYRNRIDRMNFGKLLGAPDV